MIKKMIIGVHKPILFLVTLALIFLLATINRDTVLASIDDTKIYDYYDLFSQNEKDNLEQILKDYGEEGQIDIIIITTDTLDQKTKQVYMEDFYDSMKPGFDQEYGDTVLLMLYMNPNDRSVEIQGYKKAEDYINNNRIESILDNIIPYLANQDYYEAMVEYARLSALYMNTELPTPTPYIDRTPSHNSNTNNNNSNINNSPSNYYKEGYDSPQDRMIMEMFFSIIIGIIVVVTMAYNSGGRVTTNNKTYLSNSAIKGSHDHYLRTSVTKVRKPEDTNNNNNNSSSSSHTSSGTSSGGHSHSGGGRGF